MQKLLQSWRWYGPKDPISLTDIKQAGATNIVTALHHIPHGEVWTIEEIKKRKQEIVDAGLEWKVVESVTVHEAIKTGSDKAAHYIDNYNQTIRNLAACDIHIVCYNFMPVLDWTRTDLALELKNGAKALYFNWVDLAIFDIFVLGREDADADYPSAIVEKAKEKHSKLSSEEIQHLSDNILMGIPGEKNASVEELLQNIQIYKTIGREGLRQNMKNFLEGISAVCEENNISMTLHPDDPPYQILGLPRIASSLEDFVWIKNAVDQKFNGFCFCTGSLGAGKQNNIGELFETVKDRVFFVHLRNVKKDEEGNFYEADHLDGDVNMPDIMRRLIKENQNREMPIPFRPDHGHQLLDDLHKITNPGYSAIGRLKGLAELRGLELGLIGQ